MPSKKVIAKLEKQNLQQELTHLQEYLEDYARLHYRLKDGRLNVHEMTDGERTKIENRIKFLKERLGYE